MEAKPLPVVVEAVVATEQVAFEAAKQPVFGIQLCEMASLGEAEDY